jgi:hypothetical protein
MPARLPYHFRKRGWAELYFPATIRRINLMRNLGFMNFGAEIPLPKRDKTQIPLSKVRCIYIQIEAGGEGNNSIAV